MVRAPTPEEEDRRRLCRERKVLIYERVRHVNRIKGPMRSCAMSMTASLASRTANSPAKRQLRRN